MANKWNTEYWIDSGERVGVTALTGLATMITGDATGVVSGDPDQWWLIVGLPTALVAIKCLLANLRGEGSSASLVGVTSNTVVTTPPGEVTPNA